MFLVKRNADVLPVEFAGGCLIRCDDVAQMVSQVPTREMFQDFTVSQLSQMPKMMGSKITNAKANGKQHRIDVIIGNWNALVERLNEVGIRTIDAVGKEKVIFIRNDNGFCPFVVRCGSIFEMDALTGATQGNLANFPLASLTVEELKIAIIWIGQRFPTGKNKATLTAHLLNDFRVLTGGAVAIANDDGASEEEEKSEISENDSDENDARQEKEIEEFIGGDDDVQITRFDLNTKGKLPYTANVIMALEKRVLKMKLHFDTKMTGYDIFALLNTKFNTGVNEDNAKILVGSQAYNSRIFPYETIHAYADDKTDLMIEPLLKGGGGSVRRSIGKTKKLLSTVSKESFEQSFNVATTVKETLSFSSFLDAMSCADLEEMLDNFKHGKGNIQVKLKNLITYSTEYQHIQKTIDVLTATSEKMTDALMDGIETECGDAKSSKLPTWLRWWVWL